MMIVVVGTTVATAINVLVLVASLLLLLLLLLVIVTTVTTLSTNDNALMNDQMEQQVTNGITGNECHQESKVIGHGNEHQQVANAYTEHESKHLDHNYGQSEYHVP